MDNIPCSCGGENSNCRWCDGTGFRSLRTLEVVRLEALKQLNTLGTRSGNTQKNSLSTSHPTDRVSKKNKSNRKVGSTGKNIRLELCEVCNSYVKDLNEHMRWNHTAQIRIVSVQKSQQTSVRYSILNTQRTAGDVHIKKMTKMPLVMPNVMTCPFCPAHPVHFEKHLKKVHPEQVEAISQAVAIRNTPYFCRLCFEKFLSRKLLQGHLHAKHSRADGPAEKSAKHSVLEHKQHAQESRSESRNDTSINSIMQHTCRAGVEETLRTNEAQLDAKRHWGGSFRDHGQFGSFPVHDDYGDE